VETTLGNERDLSKLRTVLEPALEGANAESDGLIADIKASDEKQRCEALKWAHEVYRAKPRRVGKRVAKAVSKLG